MCWCNNKKKIFYIFFIKETVTRSCSTRYTYVQRFLRQPVLTNYYAFITFFRRLSCFPKSNVM